MGAVVERIRAKVTRAKQHLQDFQLGLRAFYDTKPYTVAIKEDSQSGKRFYYVAKVDPVPDHLTAIAADVIQNLRSPLDQIAYQLVLDARGGTKPEWLVYYPISATASDYPATFKSKIKGVRQEVIDAIDATEPYKGGKGHALWQLNELNKPDKHELLIGAGSFSSGIEVTEFNAMLKTFPGAENLKIPPTFWNPADKQLPLKVGNELYGEPLDREVAENRRFTFDISFNQPGVIECEPALKTLQDMTNLVDAIVAGLGKFLP